MRKTNMRAMVVAMATLASIGCSGSTPAALSLRLDQPMALDWTVGVNGVDGYSGVEVQGATRSDWYFMASNDQDGMAPQTISVLVPEGDGTVTIRPWWIILKDDTRGISCDSWNGTVTTTSAAREVAIDFDATCTSEGVHVTGTFIRPL